MKKFFDSSIVKKTVLVITILLVATVLCFSQDDVDSLEQALETAQYPDNISIMDKLVTFYRDNTPPKAISIAKDAIDILESKPEAIDKKLHFMNDIGWAYQNMGQYDKAEEYILDALGTAEKLDLKHNIGAGYNHLATIYYKKANYPKALEYYMKALEIFEALDLEEELLNVYTNIGVIHYQTKDYDRALEYYDKALTLARKRDDTNMEMMVLNNIAGVYHAREDYVSSISYMREIVKIAKQMKNFYLEEVFLTNIGMLSSKLGKYDEAEQALTRALELTKISQNKTNTTEILINLGSLYEKQGKYAASLDFYQRAEEIALPLNDYNLFNTLYSKKSELYEAMGQPEKALENYKLYKSYSDSLFNEKKSTIINELQEKYETATQEQEIAKLKQTQEEKENQLLRSRHLRIILIIITLAILIILIILYVMYQIKLNANKKLDKLARFDYLTRVYNRRAIQENLAYHIQYFERSKTPFVVMMFDLDNLKYINDHSGHAAGDYVLQKLTTTISNNIRKLDILGRWGGDEFIVILPFTNIQGAKVLGDKLREVVRDEDFIYNGKRIQVSITIGLAEYTGNETAMEIINRADEVLLLGKKDGKDQVVS